MIRAIVFDCFGVLTSDGLAPFLRKHFAHDASLWQETKDMSRSVDAGLIDYDAFVADIAAMAHLDKQDVLRQIASNVPNTALFGYIAKALKPTYKIGMLSNAGRNWLDTLFEPDQLALFDAVVLSYETGFAKPHVRAYTNIAEKLGVDATECVLIDDLARHIAGAEDAGMPAIQYTTFEQMAHDLMDILGREQ